ncbi:MAG: hypothetical protein HY289_05185 [Planctomycetes bacterium]|nr:hypothetical protein [Planctomycetota bacterium]
MTLPTTNTAGLHVRYEKAGLILDALPIPWNADAVIVEANVRLPARAPREKHDFTLRTADDGPTLHAELIATQTPTRVFFRIPVPLQTCSAHVHWREHSLGQIELPILAASEFLEAIALDTPALHVVLGDRTVACQSFVTTQAKSLIASAVVRSPAPLAAAHGLAFRVDVDRSDGRPSSSTTIALTSDQLRLRQTLVAVQVPRPRTVGAYEVSWHLDARRLHAQRIRTVSKKTLMRSLRISATRFHVIRADATTQIVRTLPTIDNKLNLDGIAEVAPIFFVCSSQHGMAGLVPFTMRALVGDVVTTTGIEEKALITDGPTPIVLGVISAEALGRTKHFTLDAALTSLGNLSVLTAPIADFTAEGGFAPMDDYLWSPAAEEQLNERLGKLLDGG